MIVVLAIVAPPLWSADAARFDLPAASQGASAEHLLGTDALGRDIFKRVLVATRLSVTLALLATLVGAALGIVLGALPGLVGARLGRLVTGFINLTVALPGLLVAIFVAAIAGLGARGAVLGIAVAVAPYFARLTQTLSSSVIGSDYVAAARSPRRRADPPAPPPRPAQRRRAAPASRPRSPLGEALLALAGLSFLGLAVQPPDYDWGRMLNEGLGRIYVTPVVAIGPAVAIVLAALVFTLLGETLAKIAAGQPTSRWKAGVRRGARRAADGRREPAEAPSEAGARRRGPDRRVPGRLRPGARGLDRASRPGEIVGDRRRVGLRRRRSPRWRSPTCCRHRADDGGRASRSAAATRADLTEAERRKLLGRSLAIVYQDPMSSLNPASPRRPASSARWPRCTTGSRARRRAQRSIDRLRSVRIASPEARVRQYPHEFSGGMRQRAVIAMGLMIEPRLTIADEPTTALDVTVQQQILRLLRQVSESRDAAAIFISHDVAVVSQLCSRVVVMYAGRVVEELDVATLVEPRRTRTPRP